MAKRLAPESRRAPAICPYCRFFVLQSIIFEAPRCVSP
jgi:hypothetical protein